MTLFSSLVTQMKFGQKSVISSTAEAPFVAVQDFKPRLQILMNHFYFFNNSHVGVWKTLLIIFKHLPLKIKILEKKSLFRQISIW